MRTQRPRIPSVNDFGGCYAICIFENEICSVRSAGSAAGKKGPPQEITEDPAVLANCCPQDSCPKDCKNQVVQCNNAVGFLIGNYSLCIKDLPAVKFVTLLANGEVRS